MLSKTSKKNMRQKRKAERLAIKVQAFKETWKWLINLVDKGKRFEIYIQCNLYNKLNLLWYDVRIEMPYKLENRNMARFDLVIFHPKWNIIIETKTKWQKVTKSQTEKYSKFKAELIYCVWKEQINSTVSYIKKNYDLEEYNNYFLNDNFSKYNKKYSYSKYWQKFYKENNIKIK